MFECLNVLMLRYLKLNINKQNENLFINYFHENKINESIVYIKMI
jgi:hypothetical protein